MRILDFQDGFESNIQPTAVPASAISVTPTGTISSTDVQSALAELDTEKVAKIISVANTVPRFDGTTGQIKETGVTVDDSDNVNIPGNLTVGGTTTTINSLTLDVADKNITVAKGGNDAAAEGAGITIDRTSTKGSLVFDSTKATKFKLGLLGSEVEIVDISSSQTLSGKSISGSTNTLTNISAATALSGQVPVANGGTGSATVVVTPAASSWAGWDSNKNLSGSNMIDGFTSTATAATTTTLTVGSTGQQFFTGTTTQTVAMPAVSTLPLGIQYIISNLSTGIVTVQSSGANVIQAMAANTQLTLTCISTTGTGTASWSWIYGQLATGLPLANPMTTGGDIIYGASGGAATRLANGTSGQVLQSAGGTSAPAWQTLSGNTTALKAPTIQRFTTTGTRAAVMFTTSSANATAGATYTNNSQTFTVLQTISAGTTLFCSGAGAPTASGTLTKATGTGDATITFSAKTDMAQYTLPTGPSPIAVRVKGIGGGGGGGSSGTASTQVGVTGKPTVVIPTATFTTVTMNLAGGAGGGNAGGTGGSGGVPTIGSSATVLQIASVAGGGGGGALGTSTTQWPGGIGGSGFFGGAGVGVVSGNGSAASNSGAGGAGGGTGGTASSFPGSGGGSGAYGEIMLVGAGVTNLYYAVGTFGAGGTSGTSGNAGGNGADGILIFEETYQ